jgi:hypothetical protein
LYGTRDGLAKVHFFQPRHASRVASPAAIQPFQVPEIRKHAPAIQIDAELDGSLQTLDAGRRELT